ncbi:uncharacterized protein LOC112574606 [Pomacea canaliculata]|uniref:uncharacterized protein LOC112574606 n=1 Tax=Pomacea canaliculata TaxID=400727 RepID=UPI000D73B626|nr:uncharacterized protein LOC112574606 [Pomacea canaliculata]
MQMEAVVLTEKDVPGAFLVGDPSEYRLTELKRWHECHGQSKNVTLREAIEKICACITLGIKVNPGVDNGKWYELKRRGISNQTTPKVDTAVTTPDNGWTTFPSVDIPEMFNYGSAYHYLIESIAHFGHECNSDSSDGDSDNNGSYTTTMKPLRKGKKLMESEFIDDIQDNRSKTDYFLRAHIQHSMKNEYPLDVLIVLSNVSGFVSRASCNCKSSALGRCVHVAALLLKLVDHVEKHGHRVTTPSTSQPCVWNRGKKRSKNPKPLHEAEYKSKKFADGRVYKWDPRPKEHRGSLTNRQINDFIIDLQNISASTQEESMWETSLRILYEDYDLEVERKKTLLKHVQQLEESHIPNDISAKQMSAYGAFELLGTQEQSMSLLWIQERQYRITASKCKVCFLGDKIVENRGYNLTWKYFHWLSNNLWSPKVVQTCDMQYGLSEEPKAREAYTKATGNKVRETGLWVNRKFPYLGASPDGLATDSDGNTVGVEIKCLKILRDKSVSDLLQQHKDAKIPNGILNRQCFRISDGELKLRTNHMYYYQVQLLLLVTDLAHWDFLRIIIFLIKFGNSDSHLSLMIT